MKTSFAILQAVSPPQNRTGSLIFKPAEGIEKRTVKRRTLKNRKSQLRG
jgi:hypothetical protein